MSNENHHLPDEILHHIMEFADNKSLVSSTLVNKKWNQLSTDNSLWKDQFRFRNTYGNKNTHYPNYRKFVSQTKKQTFEYCQRQEHKEISAKKTKKLKKIAIAILALFCPPLAGCITAKIVEDDDEIYSIIGNYLCLTLVIIGTCCLWIPGVIIAWIYIYIYELKD